MGLNTSTNSVHRISPRLKNSYFGLRY